MKEFLCKIFGHQWVTPPAYKTLLGGRITKTCAICGKVKQ